MKTTFLVVDDSDVIRYKIESILSSEYEVIGDASNGVEAVRVFQEHKPSVVTMDITMPMMDGIETIQQMIKIDPTVRILVVSALSDKATLIKAMKLGAYGFLTKPFSDMQLRDAVYELIEDLEEA